MPEFKKSVRKIGSFVNRWLMAQQQKRMLASVVDVLSAIDFANSKLPVDVLEAKTNPNQECCDLEYATLAIIRKLKDDQQIIKADVQPLDEKIMALARLFKQAVEQGDVRVAYTAKAAVVRAVMDVRCRIPQIRQKLAEKFIKACVDYLDLWIDLADLARIADRTKQNVKANSARLEAVRANDQEFDEQLKTKILEEAAYTLAFNDLLDKNLPQNRAQWTREQLTVFDWMLERGIRKMNLELIIFMQQHRERDIIAKEALVEMLLSDVAALPIITAPGLISKFHESVHNLSRRSAETYAGMNAPNQTVEDIEHCLHQLNSAQFGSEELELAIEAAEKKLEELRSMDSKRLEKADEEAGRALAEMRKLAEQEREQGRIAEERKEMLSATLNPDAEQSDQDGACKFQSEWKSAEDMTPMELATELFGEDGLQELLALSEAETTEPPCKTQEMASDAGPQ